MQALLRLPPGSRAGARHAARELDGDAALLVRHALGEDVELPASVRGHAWAAAWARGERELPRYAPRVVHELRVRRLVAARVEAIDASDPARWLLEVADDHLWHGDFSMLGWGRLQLLWPAATEWHAACGLNPRFTDDGRENAFRRAVLDPDHPVGPMTACLILRTAAGTKAREVAAAGDGLAAVLEDGRLTPKPAAAAMAHVVEAEPVAFARLPARLRELTARGDRGAPGA